MVHHAEDMYSKKTLKWSYKTIKMCEGLMLVSNNEPISLYGGIELSRIGESDNFQIERVSNIGQRYTICEFGSLENEIPEMCWLMHNLVRDCYGKWKWRIVELNKPANARTQLGS